MIESFKEPLLTGLMRVPSTDFGVYLHMLSESLMKEEPIPAGGLTLTRLHHFLSPQHMPPSLSCFPALNICPRR